MTITKPTFIQGDRVRVLPLEYLKPRLRGGQGTITSWCHDNLYDITMDDGFSAVLDASEIEHLVPTPTATHTPTPWHVGMKPGPMVYGTLGEQIADCRGLDESGQNAALIVRAVNSYDGLVEALRNILADCETAEDKCDHGGASFADYDFAVVHAIEYARAALKLAEVDAAR